MENKDRKISISEDWLAVIIAFIIILLSTIEILNNYIISIAF